MTPQSTFAVVASLEPEREGDLRALLASMNHRPGLVDPQNGILPFGQFERLHFARLVILDDQTLSDATAYGGARPEFPISLAFLGDCDGPAEAFLVDLVQRAGGGLQRIFSHCRGFASGEDLLHWMKEHAQPAATTYVNWVGRTVRQIREEHGLREALETYLDSNAPSLTGKSAPQVRDDLRAFVAAEQRAGRITLTPPEPTPLDWQLRNLLHCVGVPVAGLLLAPLLLLYLPIFAFQLRRRERTDPELAPRPDPDWARRLAELEDRHVSNQFSALGSVKPGRFRRWTLQALLSVVDYGARHIYSRGHLARVGTIHFARWLFLDDKKRLLFASNYDGSLDAYMDDFINKVGWGLNIVFSNGIGYPHTNWLISGGAKDEQKFKYFIRRHELPTEIWYAAYPGLTAFDLKRNTRIREGIEKPSMTDAEAREWLRLL